MELLGVQGNFPLPAAHIMKRNMDIINRRSEPLVISIPLIREFRGVSVRESMILEGPDGPGEWAAFPEYGDNEAALWLASAIEQAYLATSQPRSVRENEVPVNGIFPDIGTNEFSQWWGLFPGATSAKVKVGSPKGSLDHDVERVRELRRALGPSVELRLDANEGWTVQQAKQALKALGPLDVSYIEQPVRTLDEMLALRLSAKKHGVRLAADELIRKSHSLETVISRDAADVAILKLGPLGGLHRTLNLARRAHRAGLQVVVSSGLETSVGLSWAARAVAILKEEWGEVPPAGLGTAVLLASDVTEKPLTIEDGHIEVRAPVLDMDKVEALRASPERTQWWQERFERCLPVALQILEAKI